MARKYYTLASQGPGERWGVEFGDYSRAAVVEEMETLKEGAEDGVKFRVIASGDTQVEIDAAIQLLNA